MLGTGFNRKAEMIESAHLTALIVLLVGVAIAPALQGESSNSVLTVLGETAARFAFKATLFGACCYAFSRYGERQITAFLRKIESPPDPMLEVASMGFVIAAIAGLVGFSVAIGAFFAGLVFSRDPRAVKLDASFNPIYEFFVPFFFIEIGLQIDPMVLTNALGVGLVILIAAVLGKLLGTSLPALTLTTWQNATLLGVSLVPRAEITLIVAERGRSLGNWALSNSLFAALVLTVGVTSVFSPLIVRRLLQRWPQMEEANP
jgi:Kef-type K+ transport system membrane component KefB